MDSGGRAHHDSSLSEEAQAAMAVFRDRIAMLDKIAMPAIKKEEPEENFFLIYYHACDMISVCMNVAVGTAFSGQFDRQCKQELRNQSKLLKRVFERWTVFLVRHFDCVGKFSLSGQYFMAKKGRGGYWVHAVNLMYERMRLLRLMRMASPSMERKFLSVDLRRLAVGIGDKVIASTRPLHEWSQKELVCTMRYLMMKEKQLRNTQDLYTLLVMMELRCCCLLMEVHPANVFDMAEYRRRVPVKHEAYRGVQHYQCNYDFMVFVTMCILTMRSRFDLYSLYKVVERPLYMHGELEGEVARLREALLEFILTKTMEIHEGLNRTMKEEVGNRWGTKFDVLLHRYKFPTSHMPRSAKYDELYPSRTKLRMDMMARKYSEVVRGEEPEYRWIKEYVVLMVVNKWFQTNHSLEFYDRYVTVNEHLHQDAIRMRESREPMLVDLFSQFYVWHQGAVYATKDIYESLALWVVLVRHKCNSELYGMVSVERFRRMLLDDFGGGAAEARNSEPCDMDESEGEEVALASEFSGVPRTDNLVLKSIFEEYERRCVRDPEDELEREFFEDPELARRSAEVVRSKIREGLYLSTDLGERKKSKNAKV